MHAVILPQAGCRVEECDTIWDESENGTAHNLIQIEKISIIYVVPSQSINFKKEKFR